MSTLLRFSVATRATFGLLALITLSAGAFAQTTFDPASIKGPRWRMIGPFRGPPSSGSRTSKLRQHPGLDSAAAIISSDSIKSAIKTD